jgi:hypothetical protein
MGFQLAKIDEDALKEVEIDIVGVGDPGNPVVKLSAGDNNHTLQFPPIITKDNKSADWKEIQSASYETMKWYIQSKSRSIGLEFQWVCGDTFTPTKIHNIISGIKSYFYTPYFGVTSGKQNYPIVKIKKFYGLIEMSGYPLEASTWRMMDVSVKYSKELYREKIASKRFYPLHTVLNMSLEFVSQLQPIELDSDSGESVSDSEDNNAPFRNFTNLARNPKFDWY